MDLAVLTSIVVAAIVVIGAVFVWGRHSRRQRLERFKDRDEISLDQIYAQFFAAKHLPKELVFELWNEVAASLRLPPGKLRPTDRFEQELTAPKGWEFDDDMADIELASKRRLNKSRSDGDFSQIKNVSDYVEFFCKLRAQQHRA